MPSAPDPSIDRVPIEIVADGAAGDQSRPVSLAGMPLWRKRELGLGLVRAALVHRAVGPGRLPIIHGGVRLREHHGAITLGRFCELHDRVVVSAIGSPGRPAALSIGDYTSIWYGTVISARTSVVIGSHCAISWSCTILDNDMHRILTEDEEPPGGTPVTIGDHVWIGASAIVLKGVTIGRDAVVAAGSVVTRDVPPLTLVAGSPARPVRRIEGWR